jgi:hypothetical protein
MVRNVARCLVWIVLSSVVACHDSKQSPAPGPAPGTAAGSGGSFVYQQLSGGTRVIRWDSPDGKQVIFLRTDMRWVCEKSGEQVKCGPAEALAPRIRAELVEPTPPPTPTPTPGSGVQLESCPCTEKPCIPMCVNPSVLPGLPDPKAGGAPAKP